MSIARVLSAAVLALCLAVSARPVSASVVARVDQSAQRMQVYVGGVLA